MRRAAALQLSDFAKALGEALTTEDLLPLYREHGPLTLTPTLTLTLALTPTPTLTLTLTLALTRRGQRLRRARHRPAQGLPG